MRAFTWMAAILAAAAAVGCGGGTSGGSGGPGGTGPSGQTLAGSWKATRAEFVSAANSSVRVEVVSMGTSLTLTLDAGGSYTQKITDPGEAGQTETGTWSATSDVLTLRPTGMSWQIQFDMKLNGGTLSLSGGHVEFDVNGDGRAEESLAYLTLNRQ